MVDRRRTVPLRAADGYLWSGQPGHTYQDSVDFVVRKPDFLTADERDWRMQRTAEEFFFKKK
ncbi:MAG TPA: hypothetical protein VKE74_16990 [Gemmataceae bacterium]|nr:hypothetical protein [Gemmataceae bacterium]